MTTLLPAMAVTEKDEADVWNRIIRYVICVRGQVLAEYRSPALDTSRGADQVRDRQYYAVHQIGLIFDTIFKLELAARRFYVIEA